MEELQTVSADSSARLDAMEAELVALRRERQLIGKIVEMVDLPKLLELLVAEIELIGDFDGYMVNFADKRRENLVCEMVKLPADFAGMDKAYLKYKFPMELVDANVEAYGQRYIVYVDKGNVANFEGDTPVRFERWLLESLVVIPILNEEHPEEEPLGTIMLCRQKGPIDRAWVAAVEQLLKLFRRQIDLAFMYSEVQEHEREIRLINDEQQRFLQFIFKVNALNSSEQVYETIAQEILRRFPFDFFGILMREGDELVPKKFKVASEKYAGECAALEEFFRGRRGYRLGSADGASVTSFEYNKPMMVPDTLKVLSLPMSEIDRQCLKLFKTPRTTVLIPIRQADRPIGLIWLVSLGRPVQFTDAQIKLVELLGSFIGTALANAELYTLAQNQKGQIEELNRSLEQKVEELNTLAVTDSLTGLSNYGFFGEELERRAHEYRRNAHHEALSLVILDIDHFKTFNDRYGHVAGNEILREVGRRIAQLARKMDIACRYGGEVFAVLLPKCDLEGARNFAERVRQDIEGVPFLTGGEEAAITVSLGCAEFDKSEAVNELVDRADRALYCAKRKGHNRVEVALAQEPGGGADG
ncbi:MAG: Response regulator PleD [Betaproteobacteria bacterium ADurb.Bin341]|nr:MAG: Response regulator PleD [Betaproteobacteria bacterium ADurb.Bin341]